MPPTSAAMELKVLISILQNGQALQNMTNQVNQLSNMLTQLQQKAAGGGSTPTGPVLSGLNAIPPAAQAAEKSIANIESAIHKVIGAVKFMAGGFLALQSVRFLKGLADEAAQVEVLTTVLHVVAQNAGYTADQIDEVDKSVQKLGVTAAASKQALTSFLQARLPLAYAKDLARAAQDLAVISGMNSSDTFKRLIVNIQQLDALGLRWMGIVVDRVAAEDKFRQKQEDTTKALNKRQQQEALMQEVLEKAAMLEGAYANAMGDVAKQLTSLDRLTETYRAALGDSLLPAYSNIVRVISTTLDKLILLSQEFSANRERSKEWAEAATVIATTFSEIILFIAKHIDQLVVLARWYLEWRLALLYINVAAKGLTWIVQAVTWINNMRVAWIALRAGMIGYTVALQALGATSTQEAIKIIAVAVAQSRVAASQAAVAATAPGAAAGMAATGTAAAGATTAIGALALAWGSIATIMAVPIVGYIIYKIRAAHEEEMKKPVLQRAAEAAEGSVLGTATVESITELLRLGRAGGPIQEAYREWRKQIDATGKSEEQLREQFAKSIVEYRKGTPFIANASVLDDYKTKIGEVREEVTRLTTEGEQLRKMQLAAKTPEDKRAIGLERATVQRQLEERQKKLVDLQREMVQAAGTRVPTAGRDDVFAQIEKYDAAQVRYDQIRDTGSRKAVAHAQAEMDVEKAILEEMKKKIELRLKVEKLTDAERKQDEEALSSIKARMTEVADRAERIRTSTETLFGSKFMFTPEGEVMSGQFAKEMSALETLLGDAKEILDEEGAVPEQIAEKIKKGITALGQSAQQPVDLTRLKKTLAEAETLGIPGTGAKGREALGLAQIGVRQAGLAVRAPLVAEGKGAVERFYAPQISAAETYLSKLKTLHASENEALEDQYRQNLVSLDKYFEQRIDRIEAEADAERQIQFLRIAEARALVGKEEDPRARAAAERKVEAEERRLSEISGRAEVETDRLRLQRAQQRRDLTREVETKTFAQRAQFGGTEEALAQLNFQIEQEAKAYRASNIVGYEDLLLKKQQAGIYDINNKAAERSHQIRMAALETEKAHIDTGQRLRAIELARVTARVAAGGGTDFEVRILRNAQIQEDLADNRKLADLEAQAMLENEIELQRTLAGLEESRRVGLLTTEEHAKQAQETQQKWDAILAGNRQALLELEEAAVNLASSTELYGRQLKASFIDGFSSALTTAITDYKNAGEAFVSLSKSIANEIVSVFTKAFTQNLFKRLNLFGFVDRLMGGLFGNTGGGGGPQMIAPGITPTMSPESFLAEGGPVSGPGTGTSDSIPAMLSAGEHIMPAAKAAQWMPVLEGIRTGRILPFATGGVVQSIALGSVIRRYANGGVVIADGGASAVQTGAGGNGNMMISLHPDALNMTMRDWLEHEVVRQQGRR
jgi:hypothetical protein